MKKQDLKDYKLFVGPMSLNVVDTVANLTADARENLGLIPSRRQIESRALGSGYVENWSTQAFCDYAKKTTNAVLLRDHAGPLQGALEDNGVASLSTDVTSGFDMIHIDPWKAHKEIDAAAAATIDLIRICAAQSDECLFEIGTEEAIRAYFVPEFRDFIERVAKGLGDSFFSDRIVYGVVQSGTNVKGLANIGDFNYERCVGMSGVCEEFGLLAKEHNSDYLDNEGFSVRKECGVDAFNVAPEFGVIETKTILFHLDDQYMYDVIEAFVNLCVNSGKWRKWVDKGTRAHDMRMLTEVCGHYLFSTDEFKAIKSMLAEKVDIDAAIKENIEARIKEILCVLK